MQAVATDVAWLVCVSDGHVCEPCKNSRTDRDATWGHPGGPKESRVIWGSKSPEGKGQFLAVVFPIQNHWPSLLWCLASVCSQQKGSFSPV